MKSLIRILAILVVGSAVLSGGAGPRLALAIDGVTQNPGNGHWYKLFPASNMKWNSCKSAAEALGGYLATITSAAEGQWIQSTLVSGQTNTFLGGSDAVTQGNWQWVTGETWGYTNWAAGEPSNSCYVNSCQDYLSTGGPYGATWDDQDNGTNDGNHAYLVEWDSDPNGPPPGPELPAAPSNLVASVSLGNPIRLTWQDNSVNEDSFDVERRTGLTAFSRIAEPGRDSTLFEDSATIPDTAYTYRVRAKNSGGASGYSNEATVTSSAIAPAPKAPSLLVVVLATPHSIELQWVDNSLDEVAFEVHRRTPTGAFAIVDSLPSNSSTYTDTDLPPDASFVFGVRCANAYRASPFVEVAAATLPTLSVTPVRGDFKDSAKPGKDSLKVWAYFDALPEASDGAFDPVLEGISLRTGTDATPLVMGLPGNLDGWKVARGKATWKSPKGSSPRYRFEVVLEERLVKVSATGLELAAPPANPVRVSLGIGNDAGTDTRDWESKKPGVLRLR